MPRFSANLGFLWTHLPLLDRIRAAAAAGFRAIELHWPYETEAEAVRQSCVQHGLILLGINTVRGDAAAGEFGLGAVPGREEEFQAAVEQSLAYCAASGATNIHCMAGRVPADDHGRARATFIDNLRRASDKAVRQGVTLLLEPINAVDAPGYFYHHAAEGAALIDQLGRHNIRLMFDCYHVGRGGADVLAELARYLPMIGHVQIAAVPSRAEPDTGTLDYRTVFSRLDQLGYAGWVGCEYKPTGDTDAGLDWTRNLGVTL